MPVKLYPAPGMRIRDPAKGDYLPAEGRTLDLDVFWRRRLRDKEVTLTAPVASSEQAEAEVDTAATGDQSAAETAASATTEGV